MYCWLILILPSVLSYVYTDWDKTICPPISNIIPNNKSDYHSLYWWLQQSLFLSNPIFGLSDFVDNAIIEHFQTPLPFKSYYVDGVTIPGVLTPSLQPVDVPAPKDPSEDLNAILRARTFSNLNCDNTNFNFIRRCGKCYHASTCLFYSLWNCIQTDDGLECKRKKNKSDTTHSHKAHFLYFCKNNRLAFGPSDVEQVIYGTVISPSSTYKLSTVKTSNCSDYAFIPTNEAISTLFVPNTPKYYIFDFYCPCKQRCLYYLYANIYTVVIDDLVEYDRLGFTKFNLESHISYLNKDKEDTHSQQYGFLYLPNTNTTFANTHWHSYTFKVKLKIVTYGYLGSYSSPYVYCVNYVPHTMTSICQASTTPNYIYTTDNGKVAYENGQTFDDPIFITPQITVKPTINSTAVPEGYKWAGSFQPAILKPKPTTVESHHLESCYTEEFEYATRVIVVPKVQPINHLSCQHLCVGKSYRTLSRAQFNIKNQCTIAEQYSPLMQQCFTIVGEIRSMSGSTLAADQHFYSENNETLVASDIFKGVDMALLKEQLQLRAKVTINDVSDRVKKFKKLFQLADTEYVYSFPKQEEAAWAVGLFKESLFNQDRDINFIAAFPWAAAWRFGRQINALSFATSTLIASYQNLVSELNTNFDLITTALQQQAEHIILNSKYINQLIKLFNHFTSNQYSNLLALNQHLTSVEYMTAKLSQFSAIRTNLQSMLLEQSILQKLLNQRVLDCNNKLKSCLDVTGVYLSHSHVTTPFNDMLIIAYLKPKCEKVEVEAYYCQNNITYVAPFGCQFLDKQLSPAMDVVNCTEPIKLQGCNYDSPDLLISTSLFRPLTKIKPYEEPLNLINYTNLIQPIETGEFKENLTQILNEIKPVSTLSQFLNTSIGDWLEKVEEYAYQGNDWLFWVKVAGIVFASLLFLPIFISCCMLSLRIAAFNQKLK
ncbi:spike protein [Serpentovirinae sp. isolate L25]|uniref:Spike protein n=1 Tax=Serpentovirinae sp. isolate L25 TaxID=3071293 RepID=A0AAE6NYT3_9NIDO|nr:spike protein [Serpentovirinae sp.]QFU19807.1 spike protein [Serpentovirinae sp.]